MNCMVRSSAPSAHRVEGKRVRVPQVGVYGQLDPVRRTTSAPQAYLHGWLNGCHLKGV